MGIAFEMKSPIVSYQQRSGRRQACWVGLVGPISPLFHHDIHVSPISLIPKAHQVNKWRLIVDLSAPQGHSTNSGISSDLCSLSYASLDEAVEVILQLGQGTTGKNGPQGCVSHCPGSPG